MSRRILIVEDDAFLALDLKTLISGRDYEVAGHAKSVRQALQMADDEDFDCCLLDVHLGKERSDPIADRLAQTGIPFAFLSGYARSSLPKDHVDRPLVSKPFSEEELFRTIDALLQPDP